MEKVKLIIRKNLKEESENYLIESLKPVSLIEDKDILSEELGNTIVKLLTEGYTIQEITNIVEQNKSWLGNLVNPKTGKLDIWNAIFGGGKSAFYEQILRWVFVDILGVSEGLGQSIAIALSEYNPLHILRLFKGYQSCVQEVGSKEGKGGLGAAIIEIFINNSQFDGKSQNVGSVGGMAKVGIRNVAAEAIRESNLDDILAEKICGYIWKKNNTKQPTQPSSPPNQPSNPAQPSQNNKPPAQ